MINKKTAPKRLAAVRKSTKTTTNTNTRKKATKRTRVKIRPALGGNIATMAKALGAASKGCAAEDLSVLPEALNGTFRRALRAKAFALYIMDQVEGRWS